MTQELAELIAAVTKMLPAKINVKKHNSYMIRSSKLLKIKEALEAVK